MLNAKTMSLSPRAKRPLTPRCIAEAGSRLISVWANWDRFELRVHGDEGNDYALALLPALPTRPLLTRMYNDFCWCASRYLVVVVGTEISMLAIWVLDSVTWQWILDIPVQADVGTIWAHATLPIFTVVVSDDITIWDIQRGEIVALLPYAAVGGANIAAIAATAAIVPAEYAIGGYEEFRVVRADGAAIAKANAPSGGDITAIASLSDGRWVTSGVRGGLDIWQSDLIHIARLQLGAQQTKPQNNQVNELLAIGPAQVCAVRRDGNAYVVNLDTHAMQVLTNVACAALVPSGELVLLGSNGDLRMVSVE
jgi:hypothetical protein